MNQKNIKSYIEEYKKNFNSISKKEIYKWKAVKQFQDNWDIDTPDFHSMLVESLSSVSNLMDSGSYFPKRMLLKNSAKTPEIIRDLFKKLFNEEMDILERVQLFIKNFKEINKQNFEFKNDYQDHRAVIVYLTLRYPERYFFYKFKMFKSFSETIEYQYNPRIGKIENIGQFQALCNLIKYQLSDDQKLLKLHKNRILEDCYFDESLNILTQDFIYAVTKHLNQIGKGKNVNTFDITFETIDSSQIQTFIPAINFTPSITNYQQNEKRNKHLGDLGELWILNLEKQKLLHAGKEKLANKVQHVAKDKGDGLGYDILSYDLNGDELYIEVKTTSGNFSSSFFITRNEFEKSKIEKDKYLLYRVFNYDEKTETAKLKVIRGELTNLCQVPLNFKVSIKNEK